MKLMLSGANGFVGAHFLEHFLLNTDWEILCPITGRHKGDYRRWAAYSDRVTPFVHDLAVPFSHRELAWMGDVDYIVNCAAESHVDRSIDDPVPFISNNVAVMTTMLELARQVMPEKFIQISTDEVYGPAEEKTLHQEWSPILPSNPYAASKACQEAIAISYWRTYGVPVILTNTMNMIGERQDSEKFVPAVIRHVLQGTEATIHGSLGNIGSRFYLHARNLADAVLFILNGIPADRYPAESRPQRLHVVGEREVDNLTMAQLIAQQIGKPLYYQLVDFHAARAGHDRRYALSGAKIAALGWTAPLSFEQSLAKTVTWTIAHPEWL